ncbi:MAG TPA: AI-2E family transporter [Verrucomicrobiae bacterium]|nr:AI-2E family transporter [Verrucomicrobiae bacterium]
MKPRSSNSVEDREKEPEKPVVSEARSSPERNVAILLSVFLVVAALRLLRELFLPLALAVLFSFLLSPLVTRFRRLHLWRVPSVFIAVFIGFAILGSLGMFLASQIGDVVHKLPEYQQNIDKKFQSVTKKGSGFIGRVSGSLEHLRKQLSESSTPTQQKEQNSQNGQKEKPTPVEVQNTPFSPLTILRKVVGSLFSFLVGVFIVVVFVIFMLIERENLRARLVRFIGGPSEQTTELLDEASARVTRYLLMQLIINVTYAIPIALGLFFIGIPNPILWGALAGLLRYIPYIGVWFAVAVAAFLSLAVDPGWAKPLMVLGLFAVVEIIVANAIEPWLYGSSTGITPLAVLVSAVFWTWLWGPLGLLLSTPLTVCLVSVGRYIPTMSFLRILFGDEPGDIRKKNHSKGNSEPRSAA